MIIAALALSTLSAQEEASFKVVIHPDNPAASAKRKDVANYFLRKVTEWPDGEDVEPIDLKMPSAVREAFSRSVHKRDVRSILSYWQRQVFSGRNTPPPAAANDEEVLSYVRDRRGAIGYVSASAETRGVCVLNVADQED